MESRVKREVELPSRKYSDVSLGSERSEKVAVASSGAAGVRGVLARRPLLGWAWLAPRELSRFRVAEFVLLAMMLGYVVSKVVHVAKEKLTFEGCYEHKHSEDCHFIGYRLKKFGQHLGGLAQSALACLLLPVTRNSLLVRVTGLSFDKLVKWHRWLGRAFVFLTFVHGIGFCVSWLSAGVFIAKMGSLEKLVGVIAGFLALVVYISSLSAVRRQQYRIFWIIHAVCWPLIMVCVLLHYEADGFVLRAALPAALFVYDKIVRAGYAKSTKVQVFQALEGGNITKLVLSNSSGLADFANRLPCAWVYLVIPAISSTEAHPFSICNSALDIAEPGQTDKIVLYIKACPSGRNRKSWTKRLESLAMSQPESVVGATAYVDGPHGGLELPYAIDAYDGVLLVCGGIGVTPILPLLQRLAHSRVHVPETSFIWCLRDISLAHEFSPAIRSLPGLGKRLHLKIHLRGELLTQQEVADLQEAIGPVKGVSLIVDNEHYPCFVSEMNHLVESYHEREKSQGLNMHGVSSSGAAPSFSSLAVCVCGPGSMIKSVEKSTATFQRNHDVQTHLHEETFHF